MSDVWFGRGITRADLEACFEALSLAERDAPLFAFSGSVDAPRLLLASRDLFGIFGVATPEDLSTRLLGSQDPGSRRLGAVWNSIPPDSARRLERLRFFVGPGTDVMTVMCRRFSGASGAIFVAAILDKRISPSTRPGSINGSFSTKNDAPTDALEVLRTARHDLAIGLGSTATMNVQAIQAMLRTRWPASRTPRFTWQTDGNLVCTQVDSMLADIVGSANASLAGRNLTDVAALVDPSGRFAVALAGHQTWSGLDVNWPITDAPAAVAVRLGAIPIFNREKAFRGYRGYGVLHLDRVSVREPISLAPARPGRLESAECVANVLRFPNAGKALSEEDQKTFVALGTELREEAGLNDAALQGGTGAETSVHPLSATDLRAREVARHGLAILERLAVGLLVSRDNVPIFANRYLLDRLGFEDEDALHAAGGMGSLFGGSPDGLTAHESAGIRGREGQAVPGQARMQTIDWDGLPATLLTLLPAEHSVDASSHHDGELQELRAILETATDGVAVIDAEYDVVSLNRSGEALFGCDRGTVIGRPFLSLFAEHNRNLAAGYLEGLRSDATKRLLNDGREFLVNAHRGGTIPVFMTLGRLSSGSSQDDRPAAGARFCALFRDLTHWKKVERDLEVAKQDAERANDLKSDFLAKVSHEVRTPLNAILGFAEVMMEERLGPVGSERYKDYLRDIHSSGTHVMSLVNDLLDLSKIEAGKMDLAVEIIDVNKVIGECVATMQPQASNARIIMRLSLSPTVPRIKADERSLRQIVLNILSNAVKFNEPGGQVIIATALTEAGQMVIRIRDTGPGMSDADVAAALEPFRQLSTARSPVNGTGLGLPLTKALVEANQAIFSIRSKLEQGTLVEVAFPPARVLAA